jgi:hypothetical protein
MKTNNIISTLSDVHRRKVELKREMAEQRSEILDLVNAINEDLTPRNLLKKIAGRVLGFTNENPSIINRLIVRNVGNLSSYLFKDSRKAHLARLLVPVAIAVLPQVIGWVRNHLPNITDMKKRFQSVLTRIESIF